MKVVIISNSDRDGGRRQQEAVDEAIEAHVASGWTVHSAATTTMLLQDSLVPVLQITTTIVFSPRG